MNVSRRTSLQATAALVLAAAIFGTTFVTVKSAVEEVPVLAFLSMRFAVGALFLTPIAVRRPKSPGTLKAGLLAGLALAVSYWLQTEGLRHTDEATSAFITYLLVIFVPLFVAVQRRRWPAVSSGVGVVVAAVGLYLLSGANGAAAGRGELLTLGCAIGFGLHILVLERYAGTVDVVRLTALQLGVVAVGFIIPGLLIGDSTFTWQTWLAVVYLGVVASAGAFLLQTWAQSKLDSTRAALLLMLEPVFALLLNAVRGRALAPRGLLGAFAIFVGIVVVELGDRRRHEIDLTGAH